MWIGVDYHPSFQQIAFFDEETGECGERQLNHSDGEAERFYRDLQKRGIRVRVGMEATGYSRLVRAAARRTRHGDLDGRSRRD
jgi:transposase